MPFDLATLLAEALIDWFRKRRMGPETPESKVIDTTIEGKSKEIEQLQREIDELREASLRLRAEAKAQTPSWWSRNRDQVLVNVVAGLIVGIPFFGLGVLVTVLVK
jgi:hypothetical protein